MTDREAMQQALEALGWTDEWRPQGLREEAIAALRERLAQPEQGGKTGWPAGMLQDDSRELSKALASKPDSKRHAREAAQLVAQSEQEPKHYPHTWGKDGERCVVCGDKDWMGTSCKKISAPQRTEQPAKIDIDYWVSSRPQIIEALAKAGFTLMSNANGFWLEPALKPEQEPVVWRDHVEQRLLTWRQSFVNRSGDQLALDDFMDKQSLDDLIDFVCSEYTAPPQRKPLTDEECDDLWAAQLFHIDDKFSARDFIRDVEDAHGIKGDA